MFRTVAALTLATCAHANSVILTDFAKHANNWIEENDPVMGGDSFNCSFKVKKTEEFAVFAGEVKIVPALQAPGFCFARTLTSKVGDFPDVSSYKNFDITVRNRGPLESFKVAFAADTTSPQFKCFKADVNVSISDSFQTISIPFENFSNEWSSATGEPTKHVPPTAKNLQDIFQLQIWSEGVASKFNIEVQSISASTGSQCPDTTYCCPDAKHCLTPTKVSCAADASICKDPQVCCPLTKLCVDVGDTCTPQCTDGGFCCPDALHCLTPTNPGKICDSDSACKSGEVCCPLIKECVSVGAACTP